MQFISLIFLFSVGLALGNSDSDALLEFIKGVEKDPEHVLGSWNGNSLQSNGCPDNWFGIECNDGHITSLTLKDLGLVGNVDFSTLSGLKMLHNLSLSNNLLSGDLSSEVGSIGSLVSLDLSRNAFHGSIPLDWANLEKLVYLNLSSNNFSGSVPAIFGSLHQLKYFDLRSNGFYGDVEGFLLQLQDLEHVDISCNDFSGSLFADNEMPNFDYLEVFDASYNQITGNIPPFNFVVSLKILRLGNNLFSGSLPEALLQDSSLVLSELDLSHNQLEGPIVSITSATLRNLNLSSNKLSGSLPAKVGHCSVVDLSNNKLSGDLAAIQNWGNYVEVINLSSNSLTGTLPNETSQFLRLNSFKVSANSLEGGLPLVIGTYPELKVVDLSLNRLGGPLPPSLFTSSRLTDLNLSGNSFTGPIPLQNSQSEVSLSSDIPLPSTQNSSLLSLDLSNNLLIGPFPPQISNLYQLKVLNIGNNSITGNIPRDMGSLDGLLYLDISHNHFEGSIPDDLPHGLIGLNMSYNNLSGIVPDNLRRFPDSSFHPGNDLLIFPNAPSSPKNIPEIPLGRKHGNGLKPATRAALIAGFVGGAALITLLSILIYYKERAHRNSAGNIGEKDDNLGRSTLPHLFGHHKNVDPSPASLSFSQDRLLSSKSRSVAEHGDISLITSDPEEPSIPEPKNKSVQSVKSLESDSSLKNKGNTSSPLCDDPRLSEHPVVLKVLSPDRLVGDLHLFDNSFIFTAEELSHAPAEVIGRSCHGTSYKATLGSGHALTVKWMREGIAKGKKEFSREAKKLGNIRHPNIVSLRGYYWGPKEHEKLVISDYIDASCLGQYLYETEPRRHPPLSLNQRLKITMDVARCLNYLHNERAIPHGNLKSTNILLESANLNAVLTDYSLHRIMTPAGTAEQVLNAGALGYRPPEFGSTSKPCPSLKGDIYAFGVILLELLTGKSAGEIVSGNSGIVDLTDWVRLLASEDRSIECFDRIILGVDNAEGPPRGMEEMLSVALRCIVHASERPNIRMVFEDLSSIVL